MTDLYYSGIPSGFKTNYKKVAAPKELDPAELEAALAELDSYESPDSIASEPVEPEESDAELEARARKNPKYAEFYAIADRIRAKRTPLSPTKFTSSAVDHLEPTPEAKQPQLVQPDVARRRVILEQRRAVQDAIKKYSPEARAAALEIERAENRKCWRIEKEAERAAYKASSAGFEKQLSKDATKLLKKLNAECAKKTKSPMLEQIAERTHELIGWWLARQRAIREYGDKAGLGRIAAMHGKGATKSQAQTRMRIIADLEAAGIWPKQPLGV
ncbi:hypothetical protein [Methylocapsa aurea]|uniref:hypothetical protein n=1 Tax=Methylocapsa aurea TaxID=663610 RepID=UPI000568D6E8|nr:hypothetical protein [Methylocapsa aurea]